MAKRTEDRAIPHVPAAMLAEQSRKDEILADLLREPLYAQMTAYEPDEHTTDPGVGAADMECVFHLHELEDDED
jgi:hypothetical protein